MEEKTSILVVDDNPENIDVVAGILGNHYKVRVARSGASALKSIAKNMSDLILLDIMMPEMDGYEVCHVLKNDPSTREIPIIFLTAKSEASEIVKGLKLGAADYVTKPFNPHVLLARINNILELNRHRRQLEDLVLSRSTELKEAHKLLDNAKAASSIQARIQSFQVSIPSQMKYVRELLSYLSACYTPLCKIHNLSVTHLGLSLNESLFNAVIHGNLEVPSSLKEEDWNLFDALLKEREGIPEYAERMVCFHYQVGDQELKIEIEDQGNGFDPSKLPDPNDPDAFLSSGRGILLIRSFMDRVEWNEKGNKIKMCKSFSRSARD
ncbi:MAG: response regulator [SAR324 cluster bacterium]|nr:response regulator [SAR324 cluster bacterium]